MTTTPAKRVPKASGPDFTAVLLEFGVMLFAVAAWAQAHGTLTNSSWTPVLAVLVAGSLFGPVKYHFIAPEREAARKSKPAYVAHLAKSAVLALACAIAAMLLVG